MSCRSSHHFRASLLNAFTLPDNDVNFDCPHGVPWIVKPAATIPGQTVVHVPAGGTATHAAPVRVDQGRYNIKEPGDFLGWRLNILFGKSDPMRIQETCSLCRAFRAKMNRWGWVRCLLHRKEIAEHLKAQARKNGITTSGEGLWKAFINAARERNKQKEKV